MHASRLMFVRVAAVSTLVLLVVAVLVIRRVELAALADGFGWGSPTLTTPSSV